MSEMSFECFGTASLYMVLFLPRLGNMIFEYLNRLSWSDGFIFKDVDVTKSI
jgi:hypothetical protein